MDLFTKKKIHCPVCGAEIDSGDAFCKACGNKIEISENLSETMVVPEFSESVFMHDSDRAALKALKAIPGFFPFFKAIMKIWNERQWNIVNMSTKIKLGEEQMPKYYNMLLPICDKLKIDVPDLYLELDVNPNAYTYGDTKPFITMTSGLLETLPDELIPTVLAHECGHIACHHTLMTTIGSIILNSTSEAGRFSGIASIVSLPLQVAFYYWMRCSEFSADRAAAVYNGSPEQMTDVCMRFAGWDKDILTEGNKEMFMKQAVGYKEMIENSKWDKTLEFFALLNASHPFTAVRAYEVNEWCKTEAFTKALSQYK